MTTTAIKYTSNATFTIPSGVSIIYVSMVAGGAGGTGGIASYPGSGGQAGGASISVPFPCSAGQVATILIGAGGTGSTSGSSGGPGTESSVTIGTFNVKAVGGYGIPVNNLLIAKEQLPTPNFGIGGIGGLRGFNIVALAGDAAYGRFPANGGGFSGGGGGGNSWLGDGAQAGLENADGTDALANTGAGGGGGGKNSNGSSNNTGGDGGSGCVIIEY